MIWVKWVYMFHYILYFILYFPCLFNNVFLLIFWAAKLNLSAIFQKREKAAAEGREINTQLTKRPKVEEVVSNTDECISIFLVRGSTVVDEDPTPFTVGCGLRNVDTLASDSKATSSCPSPLSLLGIGPM